MEWRNLPSIVLLEIYNYLSAADRLSASSVCRRWRYPVFQVPLRQNLNLIWKSESDTEKVQFLSKNFVHKVQNVRLVFDATSPQCLDVVADILGQLDGSRQLKTLRIRCTEESLVKNDLQGSHINTMIARNNFSRKVAAPLMKILDGKNCLESFSFPLVNELLEKPAKFASVLAKRKWNCIRDLFLAPLRIQFPVDDFIVPAIDFETIKQFKNLQILSVDHEMLTDEFLSKLGSDSSIGGLKRFNLIAIQPNHHISEDGWETFAQNNKACGIRLAVVGDNVEVDLGCSYLFPSMRLTHFRALYCKVLSASILDKIVEWNETTLECLELVHDHRDFIQFILQTEVPDPEDDEDDYIIFDPLMYAAEQCKKLNTIKIGFLYCGDKLLSLAHLLGPAVKRLEIPRHKILHRDVEKLTKDVSEALDRCWKPVSDRKFPSTESDARRLVHIYRSMLSDEY